MERIVELITSICPKGRLPEAFFELATIPTFNNSCANRLLGQMEQSDFVKTSREIMSKPTYKRFQSLIPEIALKHLTK
jgi:hypothetical protein